MIKRKNLTLEIYKVLLEHLKKTHPELCDYWEVPHPIGENFLTRNVTKISRAEIKNRMPVSAKNPQNRVWVPELEDSSTQVVIKRTHLVDLRQVANVDFDASNSYSNESYGGGCSSTRYNLIHASSIGGQCVYQALSSGVIGKKPHGVALNIYQLGLIGRARCSQYDASTMIYYFLQSWHCLKGKTKNPKALRYWLSTHLLLINLKFLHPPPCSHYPNKKGKIHPGIPGEIVDQKEAGHTSTPGNTRGKSSNYTR
ncbi:hypothetical protein VP01_923g5 [Puccinia sorghi]|uniref:Uncharacterized protein n=1 Tax=Puccinia sorghi TaxID=27349 RepID=A0A0L6U781_9BASI|nr:hypothetical protein VP01_923g5 [Puccinia sorghi]